MKSSSTSIRWMIVIGLIGAVLSFLVLDWQHPFTRDALKTPQQGLDTYRQTHPWLLDTGFSPVYAPFATLSLAAATLLILAGGALFGLLEETLLALLDTLSIAVVRQPQTSRFGREKSGIPTGKTGDSDAHRSALYPNIYACGAVAGSRQFTHVASHQAWCAAVNAPFINFRGFRANFSEIPTVIFVEPEVARIGINELEAQVQQIEYKITRWDPDELDRAITEDRMKGFVKVLLVPEKHRILVAMTVGQHASEMLAEFVLAMRHRPGLNKLPGRIHAYPTGLAVNKYAASNWKKAYAPERLQSG